MIGGIDIPLAVSGIARPLQVAVGVILQRWPDAVFENSATGERYDEVTNIPFAELEEMFVYRDGTAADLWDTEGAVPSAENTMIHLIQDEGLLTLVVDRRDSLVEELLAEVKAALDKDRGRSAASRS